MSNSQAVSRCGECSYESGLLDHSQIITEVTSLTDKHRQVLVSTQSQRLTERSGEVIWSPLEYTCHVRDVLRFQRQRVMAAQVQDGLVFEPMRRDERAIEERYNEQDPLVVADEMAEATSLIAESLGVLDNRGWLRVGVYPWPEPRTRSVEWISRLTAHELAHHLFDIHQLLGSAGPAPDL